MEQSKNIIKEVAISWLIGCVIVFGAGYLYFSGSLNGLIDSHHRAGMPVDEADFVRINQEAKRAWEAAPNEIQQEPMRAARNTAVCSVPRSVTGWIGTVSYVGTYIGGKDGSINIQIDPKVTLRTEGDLANHGTKIHRGTELFDQISGLAKGQRVIFSGKFTKGEQTCLNETSLTDSGSVTDPEYEFAFTDIAIAE
jgi:hypothetical protein